MSASGPHTWAHTHIHTERTKPRFAASRPTASLCSKVMREHSKVMAVSGGCAPEVTAPGDSYGLQRSCDDAALTQWLADWLAGSGFDWQHELGSDSKGIPTDLVLNRVHMSSCKDTKLPSVLLPPSSQFL